MAEQASFFPDRSPWRCALQDAEFPSALESRSGLLSNILQLS